MTEFKVDLNSVKDNAEVDWQLMLYSGKRLIRDVQEAAPKPSLIIIHLLSLREINEMYSRVTADKLLAAIRDFFKASVEGALLYRLGGGKFCVLVNETEAEAVDQTAGMLRQRFDEAWEVDATRVYCGVEMIILNSDFILHNPDPLMNVIDRALYFTLKRSKGVQYYNSDTNHLNMRSQRFDYSLKNCVRDGMRGFDVYYQPVANPMTGIWAGVEALCRWEDPESGSVPAGVFIAAAERLKLIDDIGLWVLETAVTKCKEWGLDKVEDFVLEVNVSSMQFTDPRLAERIIKIVDDNHFPSLKLCFEITDGSQVVFNSETIALMEKLKERNIAFALDDFGAGYSAFPNLSTLPVDVVKIEHGFTAGIVEDSYLRHLFRAISELAHMSNLRVVAEGVETEDQMRVLLENGADLLQGYYISRPLPPDEMAKMTHRFVKPTDAHRFYSRRIDIGDTHKFDDEFFFTSSLNKISNQCIHTLLYYKDVNVAVEKTLEIVGLHMNVSRAYVFRRNKKMLLDNTHEWCAEGVTPLKHRLVDMPAVPSLLKYFNEVGALVSSNTKELPPDLVGVLDWQGIKAIMFIPLWNGDELTGLVGFDDCYTHRVWRPEDVLFLHSYSLIIASAMSRVRESDELERLNKMFTRRIDLVNSINIMLERLSLQDDTAFGEVMSASLEKVAETTGAKYVSVFRSSYYYGTPRAQVVMRWNAEVPGVIDRSPDFLPDSPELSKMREDLRRDICLNRVYQDIPDEDDQDILVGTGAKAALAVPVFIRGEYWGTVVYQINDSRHVFENEILDLMRSVSRIIVNAVIRYETEVQLTNESSYNRELVETLSKREKMLSALNQTAVTFLAQSRKTFRDQLYIGMDVMAAYAEINHVCIWKREELYGYPRYTLYRKWSDRQGITAASIDEGGILPLAPFTDWDVIFSHNGYINCCAWELSEAKQKVMVLYDIGALLVIPVFSQNRLWGIVSFDNSGTALFSKDEVEVLRYASLMLGSVIIRDEEAAKAREAEQRVSLMLNATPLSCQLWDKDSRVIDCNEAAYKLFGLNDKDELVAKMPSFTPEFQPGGEVSLDMGMNNLRKAFSEGMVVFDWMYRLPDGKPLPTEVTLKRVEYKGGYIVAGYTRDLRRLKLLEEEAGKIYYDPLTGIFNRRFLDENLTRTVKTLSRSGGTLSFMIVDIDRFKLYNDSYGHLQGDECLRVVAETLNGCVIRSDDFVARYGGEEFAVVLPNTESDGAAIVADRLLQTVRAKRLEYLASDVADIVTVSVGVVTGKVTPAHTDQDFIRGADVMLYEAKHSGRNKYCRGTL